MAKTDSILGLSNGQNVGPALLYLGTVSGVISDDLYTGHTESTTLKWEITKTDILFSQTGTAAVNKVQTGVPMSISAIMAQPSLERLQTWFDNFELQSVSGEIDAFSFTQKIGQADSDIEQEATLVIKSKGGIDTQFQKVIFPKIAPMGSAELVYNADSQRKYTIEFAVYPDETKLVDGNPVLFYSENTVFD